MMAGRHEDERFEERYAASGAAAIMATEAAALGSDYQANGYTTRTQADELGRVLRLREGDVLLDLGAGCGWPGLYLAKTHGCGLVSIDPVEEGVAVAKARAGTDDLATRAFPMRADAEAPPLQARSVDAVVHTDLLC